MVATLPPVALFSSAAFTYDGDTLRGTSGKRVKSALTTNVGTTDTYFIGNYYEVTGGVITKYYYAGTQRIALRKNGVLMFIIGDHLGSTSLVTDSTGAVINQTQYKAWGEERYSSGSKQTNYGYTGQYSYESDFGLHFYNARWYDSSLGRFTQADSIVPSGVQGYDRYAAMNNNPVRYVDPTGHMVSDGLGDGGGCDRQCWDEAKGTNVVTTPDSYQRNTGVFGVCGSQGANNMFAQGPNCIYIIDSGDPNVHLSGMQDLDLPSGFVLEPVRYPASNNTDWNQAKTQQSQDIIELAKSYGSIILFCYSAGVDSCLFASDSITGLDTMVLIGGPYGGYDGSQDNLISSQQLNGVIEGLAGNGVNILIVDDANIWADNYKPASARGKFQEINAPDHWGLGADATFFQDVMSNWISNPDFFFSEQ